MRDKDVFRRWEKHGIKFKILVGFGITALLLAAPLILIALFVMAITKTDFVSVWTSGLLWALYAAGEIGIILLVMFEYRTLGARRVKKVNKDLEDSHFMSWGEIKCDGGFTVVDFEDLSKVKDGLLIMAERRKNKMEVVLTAPIHATLIATTGTGKTSTYVSPFIEVLSRTATNPCMIITDPKGELYRRHATTLKRNGYKVHVVNMSMTYRSTLWNPFNDITRKTERISEPIIMEKNKYRWCGELYPTYAAAEQNKKEYTVRLNDEIYVDLQDLIYTMCPVEAAQDKSWQQGARDLIFGMALRMWEDLRDGLLPAEKFNLYNLWWNLTQYARGDCEILKEYIDDLADDNSKAPSMAGTVLVSEDRTLSSYLGSVNQYLHWLADGGVQQLTSGNDIDFSDWDEDANVLFINVPEEKEGRRTLVSLMLVQLYKALLDKARRNGETGEPSLKRSCYFLMDEFGSLPRINRFEQIVPIARSRKIFMVPVVQDYKQFDIVYGQDAASIIKNNCNVKIFMGTNDDKTRNEISEMCGKQKVKSVSYNENNDMSVSTSAQSVPLIYPSELEKLNNPKDGVFGNSVVIVAGNYPIKSKNTPYFQALDIYGIEEEAIPPQKDFMIFDGQGNRYNIAETIFLMEEDEETEEPGESAEKSREENPVVTETLPPRMAADRREQEANKMFKRLETRIDYKDYTRLQTATTEGKIEMLGELCEKAACAGNMFLAAELAKIATILKYDERPTDDFRAAAEGLNE